MDPRRGAPATGNALLDQSPPDVRRTLASTARPHRLSEGEILQEAAEPIKTIYLPTSGIISLLATAADGTAVEAGLVGREGFAGIPAVLGRDSPRNVRAMSQVAGDALAVDAEAFREGLRGSEEFADLVNRYINAVWAETAQAVACNRLHSIDQRCARWLLLVRDRLGRSEFRLTQEFLAVMLGVRRPSVSVATERMQSEGLISYRRGDLKLLDPDGLRASASECYEIIRAEIDLALPGALGPLI